MKRCDSLPCVTWGPHLHSSSVLAVISLLKHWNSTGVVAEMHFPVLAHHDGVTKNESISFPKGKQCRDTAILIQKVEMQPWGAALVVQTTPPGGPASVKNPRL